MRGISNAIRSHVIVDGNRPVLGNRGDALIDAGGSSHGQVIRFIKALKTRSWSTIQPILGYSPAQPCTEDWVENNESGPAGNSNETWADGISLACPTQPFKTI